MQPRTLGRSLLGIDVLRVLHVWSLHTVQYTGSEFSSSRNAGGAGLVDVVPRPSRPSSREKQRRIRGKDVLIQGAQ